MVKPRIGACGPNQDEPIQVSQGELFRGTFNVQATLANSNLNKSSCLEFQTSHQEVPVIMKALSGAVHGSLIPPSSSWLERWLDHYYGRLVQAGLQTVETLADAFQETCSSMERLCGRCDNRATATGHRNIIHVDIRPGFDLTTNILYKQCEEVAAQMALINFESMATLYGWTAPPLHNGYIPRQGGWDATTFVWWQCISVAFAWLEERAL